MGLRRRLLRKGGDDCCIQKGDEPKAGVFHLFIPPLSSRQIHSGYFCPGSICDRERLVGTSNAALQHVPMIAKGSIEYTFGRNYTYANKHAAVRE